MTAKSATTETTTSIALASEAWAVVEARIESLRNAAALLSAAMSHAAASERDDEQIANMTAEVREIERTFMESWNQPHSVVLDRIKRADDALRELRKRTRAVRRSYARRVVSLGRRASK